MDDYTRSDWIRVSRARCCPVCEKPDWCLFAGPDDDPSAAICARVESETRCGEAGWLHRIRDDEFWRPTRCRVVQFEKPITTRIDFEKFAADCQRCADTQRVADLAKSLGLSIESLSRLRVGWSECHRAWSFPMSDASGKVRGIRLRNPDGYKFAVKRSKEGLFIPADFDTDDQLLITEGPTDCAALLDLGFTVVGRPSCTGGAELLVELIKQRQSKHVVIVADSDEHGRGQKGANNLACVLLAYAQAVRVIVPPDGIVDARDWIRRGGTYDDVQTVIEAAPSRKLPICVDGKVDRK